MEDFIDYHAKGAVNVPLYTYIDIQSGDVKPKTLLKALAYAAQGVKGVEKNESFDAQVQDALTTASRGDIKNVVVCCAAGGTLTGTQNFPFGQQSRSLIAAHRLISAIVNKTKTTENVNVYHMLGGLNRYFRDGGEGEGESDEYLDTSGKVPYVPGFTIEQDSDDLK